MNDFITLLDIIYCYCDVPLVPRFRGSFVTLPVKSALDIFKRGAYSLLRCALGVSFIFSLIFFARLRGSYGLPPTPPRRALFILYQTAVPYLALERIRKKFQNANMTLNMTLACFPLLEVDVYTEGSLECYDEESGRIDREQHLHAIANEFGKSIKGRFPVIVLRTCRLFFFYGHAIIEEEEPTCATRMTENDPLSTSQIHLLLHEDVAPVDSTTFFIIALERTRNA
ncbi:hypothetical protein Syun_030059 [Stephania yunnanensis]|uniref:Uncharacterized protein n=1 Tax=Stephania yunnanensis TaxID=152371 RepID=A0AAP0E941_9MAGN